MAYLTKEDVKTIIYGDELDVLMQAIEDHFKTAERSTVDFFKGYLRTRYDVDLLFTTWDNTGEDPRPAALVTFMCDHLLCILYATQPDRMIPENRVIRCEAAQEWLENIAKGLIDPGFPTMGGDEDINSPIKWGDKNRVNSMW